MKTQFVLLTNLIMAVSVLFSSCGNNNQTSIEETPNHKEDLQTIDGRYVHNDNQWQVELKIENNTWASKTMPVTGLPEFDNKNASYGWGIVRGKELIATYEGIEGGVVGYVHDKTVTYQSGAMRVTLDKE